MRIICTLHRNKLIYHEAKIYDGYKLTSLGYDYLALKTLVNRGLITGLGSRIGVGKESDIYEVVNAEGKRMVLKIHRLGRVCFRAIKNTRDYLLHRTAASWLYMARLAATREFAYMKALYEHGFPTPEPFDFNRHCVLMSLVHAHPMGAVTSVRNCGKIYTQLMNMIVRLAEHGLIHCDFNEFNLMIGNDENVFLIDFPQMVLSFFVFVVWC
jgi:RIO kinase 2